MVIQLGEEMVHPAQIHVAAGRFQRQFVQEFSERELVQRIEICARELADGFCDVADVGTAGFGVPFPGVLDGGAVEAEEGFPFCGFAFCGGGGAHVGDLGWRSEWVFWGGGGLTLQ